MKARDIKPDGAAVLAEASARFYPWAGSAGKLALVRLLGGPRKIPSCATKQDFPGSLLRLHDGISWMAL